MLPERPHFARFFHHAADVVLASRLPECRAGLGVDQKQLDCCHPAIAVGPGKFDEHGKRMELGVRTGDTVYYGKYSGTDVEVDGQKFVILREADILSVLE